MNVKLTLTQSQALMLELAAGQMEDDWGNREDGQTWKEFEMSTGLTRKNCKDFCDALRKLRAARYKARGEA